MMESMLSLRNLVKRYKAVYAVNDVSLELPKGEFLTLLGPSGSGKTTTLKMVAGLEIPNEGEIWVDGRDITVLPPNKRGLGMVFQNYALFPHMKVKENIAFPLKMREKLPNDQLEAKVDEFLNLVQLGGYGDRFPSQLSGGQQQRVALARALVFQPPIVLMDEPLGALDKKLRGDMQLEIKRLQQKLEITTIYVTHDQEEALTMSDRIAIMNNGKIEQIGKPRDIYEHPVNTFVANFIGESNILPVEVVEDKDGTASLKSKSGQGSVITHKHSGPIKQGDDVVLVIRPEKILIGSDLADCHKISGEVSDIIYLGDMIRYVTVVDGKYEFMVKKQTVDVRESLHVGDKVDLGWYDENAMLL